MVARERSDDVIDYYYEPLLDDESDNEDGDNECTTPLSCLASNALTVGVIVGILIQLSTLTFNVVLTRIGGSSKQYQTLEIILSLAWSLISSYCSIFVGQYMHNDATATMSRTEVRYVVGALIGVCSAWAVTDWFLGLNAQIIYAFLTLAVALLWCLYLVKKMKKTKSKKAGKSKHAWTPKRELTAAAIV